MILLHTLLALSMTDTCGFGHEGDPAHLARMQLDNFGTDVAAQLSERFLQDLFSFELRQAGDKLAVSYSDTTFDIGLRWRVVGIDVRVVSGGIAATFDIAGTTHLGALECSDAGRVTLALLPALEPSASGPVLMIGSALELQDMPIPCDNDFLGDLARDEIEAQFASLLSGLSIPLGSVMPFDTTTLLGFNALAGLRLSFVDQPLEGDPRFIMIGAPLAPTSSCAPPDYPLFRVDAFDDFRHFLCTEPVCLALGLRTLDYWRERAIEPLMEEMREKFNAQSQIKLEGTRLTLWWTGLRAHKASSCACTTDSQAYEYDLAELQPEFRFKFFTDVSPGVSLGPWDIGPYTLQLDGSIDLMLDEARELVLWIDFTRANVYGDGFDLADFFAGVLTSAGIRVQDAAWFQEKLDEATDGYGIPVSRLLKGGLAMRKTAVGTFALCDTAPSSSHQTFGWQYRWSRLPTPSSGFFPLNRSCGADSDFDGLVDAVEQLETHSDGADWDSDDDGLSDGLEDELGSAPTRADSDDDGASDWVEIVRLGTDPWVADDDHDGALDGCEDELGLNPRAPDSDGDGTIDGLESVVTTHCGGGAL